MADQVGLNIEHQKNSGADGDNIIEMTVLPHTSWRQCMAL